MSRKKILLFAIIFTAIIMRASFTGIGTILPIVMSSLGISQTVASFLSTLPLILFFIFPFIVGFSNYILGTQATMIFSTMVVCMGIIIRSMGNIATLFLGTFFIGFGINFYNVLLPGIIKKAFPSKIGAVTGIYTTVITISSGLCFYITPKFALHMKSSWRELLVFGSYLLSLLLFYGLCQKIMTFNQSVFQMRMY